MYTSTQLQSLFSYIGFKLYTKRHLKREKITVAAHNIGVSHPVLSQIENGRYTALSFKLLSKIADYYEMSIQELLNVDVQSE